MANELTGKHIAIIATDGVEQVELREPRKALQEAGAQTTLLSIKEGAIKGWNHTEWGETFKVDILVQDANPENFDGLLLPGGVMNPDKLRMDVHAVDFVKKIFAAHKPIAAICHGPWLLVEANIVQGKKVTSWPSLRTDLQNAGATWVDEQVVVYNGMVTSRKPDDIPAFNQKMIEEFQEGNHQ
jgi:protease I